MDRTTEQQQLSHGVSESSETKKDSFVIVPQCEEPTLIEIGEILNGTYQITRVIAQGGMGIVYEGIDLFLHRKVAIKVLVTDIDSEDYEKELKLFQTEVNLCGNLLHPNIVQIYYAGTYHRLPYLVMEYIDGVPINEYMNKQRCCSWKKLARLIRNIAKGLAYIHKNNILHRDIKPSNILVTAQGMPILIDFGISIKKNLVGIETNDGELSGTIRYMSPEQVSGQNDQIDERSDIYSLGLILYEILTKRPAYPGSPNEVIGQIFNSSLLPPSEVNINIPESLSNITMKAIAKNVEERYSTAEEFIEDLELYLKNVNNKPIKNKVPLWQKAFCYLKPNTATAISLIWIAFFFMAFYFIIIPIIKSLNGTGSLNHALLPGIPGPSSEHGQEDRKQASSPENNTGKDNIVKFRKAHLPHTDTIKSKNNGNILTGSQGSYGNLAQKNPKEQEKEQKTNTSNQITQATQPIENTQAPLPDNKPTKTRDKSTVIFYPGLQDTPADTPEQKESGKKRNRDVLLTGIDIKPYKDTSVDSIPGVPNNWESRKYNRKYSYDDLVGGSNSILIYIILNNMLYLVTDNGDNLTSTMVENFPPIDGYYYQKPCYQNESIIICPAYTTDSFDHFDHLAKIDLTNNKIICYNFSNEQFDNINFANGQFFTIKDTHYFLSYKPAGLYQLQLEEPEPESDAKNGTIKVKVILSQNISYSPIENTSIAVLNDTLYYFGCNWGWSGLCAVKVLDSQVKSQTRISSITVTNQSNSLLVADKINRIWIINNTAGVREYNTRKKISNEIDSYPVFSSSDSAVSFYSNGYLYCIVGEQAYMLYVGVSTEEKIIDNEFIPKGSTSSNPGQYPDVRDLTEKIDFVFVDDSLQIKLDKDNTNNKIASFVKVSDKKLRENWKREFLPIENDLDTIGIISKNDFRPYYFDLRKKFDGLSVFDSCSVLISKEYYSLEEWINLYKNSKLDILYKGTPISIPCLPFLCIGKLNPNEEVQNPNEKVQDVSKWYEDYKSKLNPREIEQFNYLDEKGYGITKGCRLIYVIPNE